MHKTFVPQFVPPDQPNQVVSADSRDTDVDCLWCVCVCMLRRRNDPATNLVYCGCMQIVLHLVLEPPRNARLLLLYATTCSIMRSRALAGRVLIKPSLLPVSSLQPLLLAIPEHPTPVNDLQRPASFLRADHLLPLSSSYPIPSYPILSYPVFSLPSHTLGLAQCWANTSTRSLQTTGSIKVTNDDVKKRTRQHFRIL